MELLEPFGGSDVLERGRLFAIAHGYSAYPMTRYARALVRDGALGSLRLVQVEYIQSGMATRVEDGPQNNRFRWILDPQRSGLALVMSHPEGKGTLVELPLLSKQKAAASIIDAAMKIRSARPLSVT